MIRERSESILFTRDDLERIVRHIAQQQITGHLDLNKQGDQLVRWLGDDGVQVITTYRQGVVEDLPALPSKKKKEK